MNNAAICIENLTKVYKTPMSRIRRLCGRAIRKDVQALNGLSLSIDAGQIFGLVGRNGQGKTTLIKCIASLVEPTSGSVSVFGLDVGREGERVRHSIGLVASDERSFYGRLDGWQNLLFFARLQGFGKSEACRRIKSLARSLDFESMLNRRFQELSAGNKQRLAIIRALLTDPPLLLFDEPTRSLDPFAAEELHCLIRDRLNREQQKTILITSHNLNEIQDLCTHVGFLSCGELKLCESMSNLRASHFSREEVIIQMRVSSADGIMENLRTCIPDLVWRPLDGLWEIRFERKKDDDLLDIALRNLMNSGGEIVSCNANRDGLKEILVMIEN